MNTILKNKSLLRAAAVILAVILFAFMMPVFTGQADAHAASYKKLKAAKYPKLTQGKLSKKQVEAVLEAVIASGGSGQDGKLVLSKSKISKLGKSNDNMVRRIALFSTKWIDNPYSYQKQESKEIYQWCEAHPLSQSNRVLSFFTSYRFKKNKKYKSPAYGNLVWRTDKKKVYFYGGIGYESGCKITSGKYNSKKAVLKVTRYFMDEEMGTYTVTLKKNSKKKFVLSSIREN